MQRLRERLLPRLKNLYGRRAEECLDKIVALVEASPFYASSTAVSTDRPIWDERDVVLITYGDQVRFDECAEEQGSPLSALARFLSEAGLDGLIDTVHLLPCFPWSSDDGFSVIDYRRIDPALGDWDDIERLRGDYRLMFDLVLNHVSRRSRWFEEYLAGHEPFKRFFIEVDPAADTSSVVRPRSLPLLTEVETAEGPRYVWTTFSEDQIDLDYGEPDVLAEMVDVFLLYLSHGARIVRLDAIAYLWKRLGTPCIHLPQTHQVVKLLRDLAEELSPGTIILTETNVPHEENVSYFGDSDEAQMVYQFSLAPLLLEALLSGDGRLLSEWLASMRPLPLGATVLNFTASHDGVGVRPLEGLMPPDRFERLVDAVRARGGYVSTKRGRDGVDSPYELNISYFSALAEPDATDGREVQIARFLASQAVMLSLAGVPAVYFHSLVATPNDTEGVKASGRSRSINRRKFSAKELRNMLADAGSTPARVLKAYRHMLSVRVAQAAFHPDASQMPLDLGRKELFAFVRDTGRHFSTREKIAVIANLSHGKQTVDLAAETDFPCAVDLLSGAPDEEIRILKLNPYQVAWLRVC